MSPHLKSDAALPCEMLVFNCTTTLIPLPLHVISRSTGELFQPHVTLTCGRLTPKIDNFMLLPHRPLVPICIKIGYFQNIMNTSLVTRTDGQVENIMPPSPCQYGLAETGREHNASLPVPVWPGGDRSRT